MSKYTFLTQEQLFEYYEDQLEVIKKRGTKAAITDFSILLGGYVRDAYHIDGDDSLEGRTGCYWTKSAHRTFSARAVANDGSRYYYNVSMRDNGARPALPFSSIREIPTNGVSGRRVADGVLEVEYGYYPQKAVSKQMQSELERLLKLRKLQRTGNGYTTDSQDYNEYGEKFKPQRHEEYEYNGKRYVRVIANSCYEGQEFTLSNGENYQDGDAVWVEVEPIKWLVDEKAKIMITDKIIFAGVQFNNEENYRTEDFDKTDIKKFIDEYWSKDIEQQRTQTKQEEIPERSTRKTRLQKLNPDTTPQSQRVKMTDTEIIQNWIESGESVLLRGPSGIGKTERIKSLYPDLIYLKLTNNMFPEKVVGSTNLQTGQSIPPDFAKQVIMQAATEEERHEIDGNIQAIYRLAETIYERSKQSDKKIVILLDELLNVKQAVQTLVYTLVLNRVVEIGNGIKLPDNVVIVATGNSKKYSSVAEDLAEPLEKRFDHILDMEPKVGEWITEYAIPQKVHPAVIGYILSKYNEKGKSEEIGDIGYFYEEPEVAEEHLDKNGCKGRTNDPRGWTAISGMLYNFEKNLTSGEFKRKDVKDILQRTIGSKLREDWAIEFFNFYNLLTLTPEEVVEKSYTQADLPQDVSERFAYTMALLTADESQVEACREFIRQNCDPEYLSIYDIYWAGKDEKRMEKISELQEMSMMSQKGHTAKEAQVYATEGVEGYGKVGGMYSAHLGRDTKERNEEI